MDTSQERTWLLSIHITDLSVEKTLRVNGDLNIGGVMFKLVESLGEYRSTFVIFVFDLS